MRLEMPALRHGLHRCLPLCLYLLPVWLLWVAVMHFTSGQFTYTLDDPYIHLAWARALSTGHAGLHPAEASVPSSSIVWPWLLLPWVQQPWVEWVPLCLNVVCLAGSVAVIRRVLSPVAGLPREALTVVILLGSNLYGLVFMGMEHSLQAWLALLVAEQLLKLEAGPLPRRDLLCCCLALWLGPWVRYESLAISVPMLVALHLAGHRRAAALTLLGLATSLGLASAGFQAVCGTLLPTSVMAKATDGQVASLLAVALSNLIDLGWMLAVAGLCGRLLPASQRRHTLLYWLPVALLLLVAGKSSFHRYASFLMAYTLLLAASVLVRRWPQRWRLFYWLLPVLMPMVVQTLVVPLAAGNIHGQQVQMARLARHLGAPVAVNDLGLMAWRAGVPVLDLFGLASPEAMRLRRDPQAQPAVWMADLTARRGVRFAMVYDAWFPQRPPGWHKVADLVLTLPNFAAAEPAAGIYALDAPGVAQARAGLQWLVAHPQGGHFTVRWQEAPP